MQATVEAASSQLLREEVPIRGSQNHPGVLHDGSSDPNFGTIRGNDCFHLIAFGISELEGLMDVCNKNERTFHETVRQNVSILPKVSVGTRLISMIWSKKDKNEVSSNGSNGNGNSEEVRIMVSGVLYQMSLALKDLDQAIQSMSTGFQGPVSLQWYESRSARVDRIRRDLEILQGEKGKTELERSFGSSGDLEKALILNLHRVISPLNDAWRGMIINFPRGGWKAVELATDPVKVLAEQCRELGIVIQKYFGA